MSGTPHQRTLILLRHAKAEHHGYVTDDQRKLTTTGRRQARAVGASLLAAGLVPEQVLCSIAVRTQQTFELLATAFDEPPPVEYSEDLYGAGVSGTLEVIAGVSLAVRTVLVVGHEPVMSGVASILAGPGSAQAALARVRTGVPVGTYSVLRLDATWDGLERESALLTTVTSPPHHP